MNKNDKRYIQTEDLILKVFGELIYEKGFDRVTVKDITKSAGISRGAFYIHYEDKYALLSHCEEKIVNELKSLACNTIHIENNSSKEQLEYFFTKIISYYKKNYLIVITLLNETRNSKLKDWIKQNLENNILKFYFDINGIKKSTIPMYYLSSYVYYSHFAIIFEWIKGGMKESPEKIAEIITNLSFNGIFSL